MKVALCLKSSARLLAAMLLVAGLAVSAHAEKVLIDMGNNVIQFRGVPVANPDVNGNYWNSLQPGLFYTNLIGTNNIGTGINFGFSNGVGTDSFNGPAGAVSFPAPTPAEIAATDIDAAALGDLGIINATFDYANSNGGGVPTKFEIQNLNPNEKYTLTIFGSHKFNADATTVYSVYSDNTYAAPALIGTANLNVHDLVDASKHNRDTVATISNLTPGVSNILYVSFMGTNGAEGYINAMKITGVPEPSSILLLASGAAALVFGWRRRR